MPEKCKFQTPAPEDLNQMKEKRSDQDVSYSPDRKVEVMGKNTNDKSVAKKTLDQHVRNVEVRDSEDKIEVEPQISSISEDTLRTHITSTILDHLTSESFWSRLEQRTTREVDATITKIACQAQVQHAVGQLQNMSQELQSSNKSVFQSRVQAPARSCQEECTSKLGFSSCIASLINIVVMESRNQMKERLRSMFPIFQRICNSATRIMDDVVENILDLVINEASKSSHDLSEASEHILYRIDSDDSQSLLREPTVFTPADKSDEHAIPVPPPPSTKKPGKRIFLCYIRFYNFYLFKGTFSRHNFASCKFILNVF